jgi:hypothetical protein
MSHYVLVQEPRRKSFYVICGDVDECLIVVDKETSTAPVGTRVTMLRSTGGDVLDVLSAWRVEKRGQARRYRVNSSLGLKFGDQRKVKAMHAFWRSRASRGDVKPGFIVPPHFSTWKELEDEAKKDKFAKTKCLAERLYEKVRRDEFPKRPSRKGAVFVCPTRAGFCTPRGKYDFKYHRYFEVLVTGTIFYADGVMFSRGYNELQKFPNSTWATKDAQGYWRGEHSFEMEQIPELVVHGEVVVIGSAEAA